MTIRSPELVQESTTVRSFRVAALQAAFLMLERVAPGLGGWWAARLWCTVPTSAGRRRDNRPRPGRESTVRLPGAGSVAVETWGSGPAVYLVHGWGGWRGQLGSFVAPLVAAGFRVVAFDGPSHAESGPGALGPRRSTLEELTVALMEVAAVHGPPASVVAHSMGCAATALAVADGWSTPKLAFVAPSAGPGGPLRLFRAGLGYGERTERRMLAHLERMVDRPLSDFNVPAMAGHTSFPSTLIVHDHADREVDFSEGEAIDRAWPDTEFVATTGLGHQRILRDEEVVNRVVDFLTASDR